MRRARTSRSCRTVPAELRPGAPVASARDVTGESVSVSTMSRSGPGVAPQGTPDPVVSVIVLAWRLADGLRHCLAALSASAGAPPFEVIVVLNGADSLVRLALDDRDDVRTVEIPVNVGYGDGCRAGAAAARGRHLAFVNDDAVVDPDWLRTLVAVAESDSRIGAVGSLLLESDGSTVQELGARIVPDAHPRPWGQGSTVAAAEARGVLAAREVDFASGAALLVRRDAFDQVGGFDPAYRPAYYEDVDLCLRIRQAGWTVRVEPAARVVHAGGGSTATDRHFRDFAIQHARAVFRERWRATLAAAPPPDAPIDEVCDPRLDPVVTVRRVDEPPESIALGIAADFRAWASRRLDRLELLERVALPRLESLENEVADIRTRGLLGLTRWRIGVWLRARRETDEDRSDRAAVRERNTAPD